MIKKKTLKKIHFWIGITIGVIWTIQGVTGALLVFHRELNLIGRASFADGPSLPPSQLLQQAEHLAGRPIQRLNAEGIEPRLIEARYRGHDGEPRAILLDRADSNVIDRQDRDPATPFTGSLWRWVMRLHVALVAGQTGEWLIGISGLFLLGSLIAGLKVAWPLKRKWRPVFSVSQWKSRPQKLYGWHRMAGLASAAALLLLTITGTYMVITHTVLHEFGMRDAYENAIAIQHPLAAHAHEMIGPDVVGPDAALQRAKEVFPDGKFVNLQTPVETSGTYIVRLLRACEWRSWAGRATVVINADTGQLLTTYDPCTAGILHKLDDAAFPLHSGEAGGIIGRLLTVAAGLALPALYCLGLFSWLDRKRRQSKRRT